MSKKLAAWFCAGSALVSSGFSQQAPPPIQWQRTYGGTADDLLLSVSQTRDGGYVLGGRSSAQPGGTKTSPHYGDFDYWIERVDASGNQLWDRSYGGSAFDELRSIRETGDGGFILAGSSDSGLDGNKTVANWGGRDLWVLKLDAEGQRIWDRTYGGSGTDTGFVVREVPAGGYLVGGTSSSPTGGTKTAPHYGLADFWIVRVDANGNPLWDRSFGTAGQDELHCLETTPDGGFIIGGSSAMGASGNKQSFNAGGIDFWVIRLDSNGHIIWEKSYGGGSRDELHAIVPTTDGGFMLGGYSDSAPYSAKTVFGFGGVDLWLVRIDSNGSKLWDRGFGGDGDDSFEKSFSMGGTTDGGFILGTGTGGYSGNGNKSAPNYGGHDMWVVHLNASGEKVWDQAFGAAGKDVSYSVQQTADGGFMVAGQSDSAVGANKTAPTLGGADYWVVKTGFGELAGGAVVDYFVAPNGQPTGDGTKDKPWDLPTAIAPGTPVKPGDRVNLRGGVYAGNYVSHLRGTSNAPVTLQAYRNEHAVIDGYPAPDSFPLDVRGEWAIYKGFEVTQSSTWSAGTPTPVGVQCDSPHIKLVNLIIHDAGQGIGFWDGAVDSEIYGCIIYHNGADNQEHGIYTQNDMGTKWIHDNIIFNNSGFGVHAYTTGSQVRNYNFQGNIMFNSGSKFWEHRNANLFVGGYPPTDQLTIISNFTFTTPTFSHFNVLLSDRNRFGNPNGSVTLLNNKFVGGSAYTGDDFLSVVFSNNLLVVNAGRLLRARPAVPVTYANYTWNHNTYYGATPSATTFSDGVADMDYATWKAVTGKDAQSNYQTGMPPGADVNVRPNKYTPGRAHIAVYNWDLLDFVPVDLSGIGLVHGQKYEIRNAQNYVVNGQYTFGTPVVVANYDSNQPVVQVPMKTAEAMAVADPGYAGGYVPPTTFPLFGAFVVAPPSDGVPVVATPPVSHWKFDEPGGLSVLDSSAANHGVLANSPSRVVGRSGGAIQFDGVNDYVSIPHNNTLNLGRNMSLSLWLKPGTQINGGSGRKDILQKFSSYWLMFNYPYGDGRLAFILNGGAPGVHSTTAVWQPDRWYHIAATLNNGGLSLYVNGQLEGQYAVATQPWTTGSPLEIGGNSSQNFYFPGLIDDVRVYNVTLTSSEIQSVYLNSNHDNAAPELSQLADTTTLEDTPTAPMAFTVSDDLTSPESLEVTVRSSNTLLIPMGNAAVTGTGTNRFLVLTPYANQHGTATITVTVRDGFGLEVERSFQLTVTSVNDTPMVGPIPPRTIIQGTGPAQVPVTVSDVETAPNSLVVTASSSNPALIPTGSLQWTGLGQARILSFQSVSGMAGWSELTVTVRDEQSATAQVTFRVTVNASNQPPSLSPVADHEIDEDGTAGPVAFAVNDAESDNVALITGVLSSNQALLPNENILLGGDGVSRNLLLTPLPQASGVTLVSIWVRDEHGASVTNTFTLTVRPVNDKPTVSSVESFSLGKNQSSEFLAFTVADFETPVAALTVTASSSNPALVPVGGVVLGGTGANRTVKVTPTQDQLGTAAITLTVHDGVLSASTTFLILVQETGPVHPNLTGHWRFDELSGLQARDSAWTNHGTLLNGASRVVGKIGYGVQVDGINQVVNVPYSDGISLQPPLTISVWFKPSQLINQNSGRKDLLQKFGSYWLIFNYPTGDGKLAFVLNSGTPVVKSQKTSWDADRWYHATATFGSGAMRLYIDGVLEGETAASGFLHVDRDYPLQFGGNSSQGVYFAGRMDDVRFYNKVLSQQEITQLVAEATTANNPPAIGNLPNLTLPEDTLIGPIDLGVSDQETPADSLIVGVTSSNHLLFSPTRITLGRNGDAYTLILDPAPHASGSATITVTVTDGQTAQTTRSFVVTLEPENDLPSISTLEDRVVQEDTSTGPIPFTVGDVESAPGALVVTAQSSNPSVVNPGDIVLGGTGATRVLEVFPAPNSSGSSTITVRVTDPQGGDSTQSFILTITAVNDAPTAVGLGNQSVDQDSGPATVPFGVEDPDSLASGITITALASNTTLLQQVAVGGQGANRTLTFTPGPGQHGSTQITLTLTDQEGGTTPHPITVTVRRLNQRPTLSGLINISTQEDVLPSLIAFSVGDEFTLIADLLITAVSSDSQLVPNSNLIVTGTGPQRLLSVRPLTNAFGSATITVTVTDGDGGATSQDIQVSVTPVNDPPQISYIPNQTIEQGFSTSPISFIVHDPDYPVGSLILSASSSNPTLLSQGGIVFGGANGQRTVTLNPSPGGTGTTEVNITVSDTERTASTLFTLSVVATNTFPSISGPTQAATDEDTLSTILTFTLADQETPANQLTLSARAADDALLPTANIQINGTGPTRIVQLIGATNAFGSTQVTFTVTDGKGASVSTALTLTIRPVNDAPTLSTIPDQTTGKGQSTELITFLVDDLESAPETLTVTATADNSALVPPSNIQLGGTGPARTIRLTPVTGMSGSTRVSLSVNDGNLSTTRTFDWLVEDVAPPPPGVVSWWGFDETGGDLVADNQGINPGTMTLGASRTPGRFGNALAMDGQNDHVHVPDSASLDLSTTMSFSLWFKPGRLLDRTSQRRDLFSKFTSYWLILNYPNQDGKLSYVLNSGAPLVSTTTAVWESNRWYHLVGTYDGTRLRIYVNGQMENEVVAPGVIAQNNHPFTIGGTPAQGQFVSGLIEDMMLFNRALQSEEISAMYINAGSGNTKPYISGFGDLTLEMGHSSAAMPFTILDAETPADQLAVTATSSDPELIPPDGLVLETATTNRTLTVIPAAARTGTALVEVAVTDATGSRTSTTFVVTVTGTNPSVPIRVSLALTASGMQLSWNSVPGRHYRIQWNNQLDNDNWINLAEQIIAGGPSTSLDLPSGAAPAMFYRVLELP